MARIAFVVGSLIAVLLLVPRQADAACNAAIDCSAHGFCLGNDSCSCSVGYAGPNCNQCAVGYFSYPYCSFCQANTTCNGNGSCAGTGSCSCNPGFTGTNCNLCAFNYYSYPRCVFCLAPTTCNGHGACGASGQCVCSTGWTGPTCNVTTTSSLESPGASRTFLAGRVLAVAASAHRRRTVGRGATTSAGGLRPNGAAMSVSAEFDDRTRDRRSRTRHVPIDP